MEINTLTGFITLTNQHRPSDGWIFRGLKKVTYDLKPPAGREGFLPIAPSADNDEMINQYFHHLDNWIRDAEIFRPSISKQSKLEQMILAQQYGFPTLLLCWTRNPLVALFFACDVPDHRPTAVWCFRPRYVIDEDGITNIEERVGYLQPQLNDVRLKARDAVFTFHKNFTNPMDVVFMSEVQNDEEEYQQDEVIRKITITDPIGILGDLDRLGINRKSLYPDLQGVSEYHKWVLGKSGIGMIPILKPTHEFDIDVSRINYLPFQ